MNNTPVLYITFARPEYASQSFAAIKKAQPKKLYFYSNKARDDRPDEVSRNEEVRSYVRQIDWACEVKTWFRDEYVDVFTSLWGAIDWVFDNEEQAIVIEEDVIASPAFFDYVGKLINTYKDNKKVWIISGNNALPKYTPKNLSYFPTRFADIYGWASWRDRWKQVDKRLTFWPEFRKSPEFRSYYETWLQRFFMRMYFDQVFNKIDHYNPWDFIFTCNMVRNQAYCLMPTGNLNQDIGVAGVNHGQAMESPLSRLSYEGDTYMISYEPEEICPTSFDGIFFREDRLKGLIRRKIKKYLHI